MKPVSPVLSPLPWRRLAAELASREARGPASLRMGLLDALSSLTRSQVCEGVLLEEYQE